MGTGGRPRGRPRWWVLLPGLVGCSDDRPESSGPLAAAWLEDVNLREGSLILGNMSGHADLVAETLAGTELVTRVKLSGVGLGFGLEITPSGPGASRTAFGFPPEPTEASDLFGWYHGNAEGLSVVAGVEVHHLRNDRDVRLDLTTVPLGASLIVGYEWLKVAVDDDDTSTSTWDVRYGGDATGDTGAR